MGRQKNYIVILSMLCSCIVLTQKPLQYKLKIGDNLNIIQKMVQTIELDIDGSQHVMTNELENEFSFVFTKLNDRCVDMALLFDKFRLKISSNLYGIIT